MGVIDAPPSKWKRRYWKNPEKRRLISRNYRAKNLELVRRKNREWSKNNPEWVTKTKAAWYQANKEKVKARARKHYRENQPAHYLTCLAWRQKNKKKVGQYSRKYVLKNLPQYTAYAQKRRALKRLATINLAKIKDWMTVVRSKPTAICYYCGSTVKSDSVHFDHIVALSKGGPHCVENLCVSCERCNCSKGSKSVRAWIRIGQQVLEI